MNKLRFSLATLFFYCCTVQSCAQQTGTGDKSLKKIYEATTPCNDEVKEMLGIPADFKCEMMKWSLTLSGDSKKQPSFFNLIYTYGLAKQGTRGFTESAKTIELKGKWAIEQGNSKTGKAIIITLIADNSPVSLSFLQPGQNLLHLLNKNKQMVNGTAAWSYTLNRTEPVTPSSGKFTPRLVTSAQLPVSTDTVGIFYGRTPCNKALREINNISAEGCQLVKCRLVLLQDTNTHLPTNFIIQTVYVGKGDNKYTVTGTWKLLEGIIDDPAAVVYQLLPAPGTSQNQLLLLKADDNILYFIDNDTHLLVGDSYCSYTLNKAK